MSVFPPDQGNRNKNKNKQMGPNQTYKLLHSKGNPFKNNEKTNYRERKYVQMMSPTRA